MMKQLIPTKDFFFFFLITRPMQYNTIPLRISCQSHGIKIASLHQCHCRCLFFSFLVYVLCVPLAVTYKRIAPQRKILHAESSRELNRANVSRKRKKPGAGTYIRRNRRTCEILTNISN